MAERKTKKDLIEDQESAVAAKVTGKARAEADEAAAAKVSGKSKQDSGTAAKPTKSAKAKAADTGGATATAAAEAKHAEEVHDQEQPGENTEATATALTEQAEQEAADAEAAEDTKTAKAGKRSAKSLKEAEEKQAKEVHKAQKAEADGQADKPKPVQKVRSRLERRGKKFRKAAEGLEAGKEYSLKEALALAIKTSPVKFDATVELHANLGVDPRHADQNIRDNLVLPAGTGRSVRVAVFADTADQAKAKKAGADIAGNEDFLAQLEKGELNFDILIATPAMMPKLGKYARTLGPKGLMPNPKSGTVTPDVAKAVGEAKAGRVEYRVDSTGIVHLGIGKVSFGADKLSQNAQAVFASLKAAKPASIKGTYIKSVYLTTTMGPSVRVAVSEV